MLTLALWLAAAPVYDDAAFRDDLPDSPPVAQEEEAAPPAEVAVEEAPPPPVEEPPEPRQPFQQWGVTWNLRATVPLQSSGGGAGVEAGLGGRFGMRAPPEEGAYVTPAIAFLVTAGFQSEGAAGAMQLSQPGAFTGPTGQVGGDVRLELTVSRRGGMLLPDVATWISTGSSLVFGRGGAGIATHVGFGLGIDFARDVTPVLAGVLFSPDSFKGMLDFTLRVAVGCMKTGYGVLVGLAAVVVVPIFCVAALGAVVLGGTAVSATQLEVRYTVLASQRGFDGQAGLLIGVGI